MPGQLARAVCRAFDLGEPVGPPVAVEGGLSHRMWRLTTTTGRYAVKELNWDFGNPQYLASYDRAFAVELAALAGGVPMPRPVPAPGTERCYAELSGAGDRLVTVRVHAWVDGRMPTPGDEIATIARAVGRLLAMIHGLRLPSEQRVEELMWVRGPAHWQELNRRVQRAGLSWAGRFRDLLPVIAELEGAVSAARRKSGEAILSHRDVDPKNVLIDADGAPVLLDWDSAGPIDPYHELATAALDWSGVHEGEPDPTVMRAVLDGYRSGGGTTPRPAP